MGPFETAEETGGNWKSEGKAGLRLGVCWDLVEEDEAAALLWLRLRLKKGRVPLFCGEESLLAATKFAGESKLISRPCKGGMAISGTPRDVLTSLYAGEGLTVVGLGNGPSEEVKEIEVSDGVLEDADAMLGARCCLSRSGEDETCSSSD